MGFYCRGCKIQLPIIGSNFLFRQFHSGLRENFILNLQWLIASVQT